MTKIHPKFNDKSIQKTCSKKESQTMKTHQKSDLKIKLTSIKNQSKNRCEKRDEKKEAIPEKTWAGGMREIPKGYHFKRILRKKTEKKAD